MKRPTVLLIGETDRLEFREAVRWLSERTDLTALPDVASALAALQDTETLPDLAVIGQSRPGQFSDQQIGEVRGVAPLVPLIALLGSLCEGEPQPGRPWPGVVRIYWHQFLPRCARELQRIASGQCPSWGLPLTVTADEMVEYASAEPLPKRSGLIGIRAVHAVTYESLAGACRAAGYATVWLRPGQDVQVQGVAAVIWDDACCDPPQASQIAELAESVHPAPIVVLLHFPRTRDCDRAVAAGAACVVSKPFLLDDLFWQLDRALGRRGESTVSQGAA